MASRLESLHGRIAFVFALLAFPLFSAAYTQDKPKIEIVPQIAHTFAVWSVAFSPDGSRVLSGSSDNTLKLWDAATGTLLRTFEGHSDVVTSVAFSPDEFPCSGTRRPTNSSAPSRGTP
jgi:WD40 repeat protein